MKFKKTYLLLCILPLLSFSAHKYYISLTEINFIKEKETVQIIMNVFMDDLEFTLNKENDINLQLTTDRELANNDIYFSTYLKENFSLKINNKEVIYTYLGKEYDADIIYFYLEITHIQEITSLEVVNKVLMKDFKKQQNMIKVNLEKEKKSVLLSIENDKALLKF
jgi:hypothetical protein